MMKLTATLKRRITHDWGTLFPGLGVYKDMWLARRVGPLVQGICLDRDSGNVAYFPTTHLHNLCRPSQTISLSLSQRLLNKRSGVQDRISVQFHSEHYRDAAQRLSDSSLLPLQGDLTIEQILVAYKNYRNLGRPDSLYPLWLFEDEAYLLSWVGRHADAVKLLAEHTGEMNRWPKEVLAQLGGVEGWFESIRGNVADREAVQARADFEASHLRVAGLPEAQLVD